MSSQEEHRVVDSPSGIFAAAHLPLGSSLLYSLEAAARVDVAVGEGSDNYPPPASATDAGRPSTCGPNTLLLTRSERKWLSLAELNGWPSWVLLGKPFPVLMASSSRYLSSFLTFDIGFFCFCLTYFCFAVFTSRSGCLVWSS